MADAPTAGGPMAGAGPQIFLTRVNFYRYICHMSNLNPRSSRSREAILDAAWKSIVEQGLAVSMAEIADAVGMTRQSIYVHFKSRGGLLLALVRCADEREGIHGRLLAAIAVEDPRERLDTFLAVWFDFVEKIHPVARQLIAARDHDSEAAKAWQDRMEELRQGLLLLTRSLRRDAALSADWTGPAAADYLWAATSVQVWALLAEQRGWGGKRAAKVLRRTLARELVDGVRESSLVSVEKFE